ncbi:Uncharacterised protein [Mycobacterium tuberculosis]|nr:Uncharacterised protein [Mycobacterium tuberculosis]
MRADMSVTSMLDREVYVYAEVDKLIGLPAGTAKRWINGYERGGKDHPPILRVTRELRRGLRGASSSRLACLLNTATAGKCQ